MSTLPPGRASIEDPAPHHAAHRLLSVKYRKMVARSASISRLRSRRCGSLGINVCSTFLVFALPAGFGTAAAGFQFSRDFEPVQGVVPHAFEHLCGGPQCLLPCSVEAELPVAANVQQTGLGQRAKLERHCAKSDVRHRTVNLARTALCVPHQSQDFALAWRTERCK